MFITGFDDRFVTWANELKLYRVRCILSDIRNDRNDVLENELFNRSTVVKDYVAELECQIPHPPHYVKCAKIIPPQIGNASISTSIFDDVRLSLGLASGRVTVLSFDEINHTVGHSHPHVVREFGPRINRPCNDLAHHRIRPEIFAIGYERSRHDYAILVFDTTRGSAPEGQENNSGRISPALSQGTSLSHQKPSNNVISDSNSAFAEIEYGSTCHSLCWFRDEPDTLVAGINSKFLKVFDIRNTAGLHGGKAVLQTNTKYVYGVCIDPWLDHRVAAFHDNSLTIWDTRNFEKPIVTLIQNKRIMKLAWSPTRSGLLCSVEMGGSQLNLHDIQGWAISSDDGDPAVTERAIPNYTPITDTSNRGNEGIDTDDFKRLSVGSESGVGDVITSFSWHPTQQNNLIAITRGGKLFQASVPERITPTWSNHHNLIWPYRGTLRSFDNQSNLYDESLSIVNDVSRKMRTRAEQNIFHQKMNPETLSEHLDSGVIEAWKWMDRCKILMLDPNFRNQFSRSTTYPGVRTAFGLDKIKPNTPSEAVSSLVSSSITNSNLAMNLGSDITYGYWDDHYGNSGNRTLGSEDQSGLSQLDPRMMRPKKIYVGPGRERTLKICGWGSDDAELSRFLNELEKEGDYERAAAIATFCLQIRKATEILQRGGSKSNQCKNNSNHASPLVAGSSHDLGVVAMALSGFSEERSGSLWREMVSSSHKDMSNPYLRAMFTFLLAVSTTGGNSNPSESLFTAVLDEDIITSDKIAFSSLHLPDQKLLWYVNDYWKSVLETGDLSGFYICGGSSQESIELLQKYIDKTGDLQTACWLAIKALTPELAKGEQVRFWIDCYKNLLDSWGLYIARIKLDDALNEVGALSNQEYQIYIACTYCQSTICRSDAQIKRHLTNPQANSNGTDASISQSVGGSHLKDDQRSKRPIPGTPKSQTQNQAGGNPVARYRSAAIACSQTNIRNEMCPSCRKPLPRCAICLLNMGTLSGLVETKRQTSNKQRRQNMQNEQKLTPFDRFFTWCQFCHHGGHAKHILDWFSTHLLCPVFKCGCRCASLDPGTKLAEKSLLNATDVDGVKQLVTAIKENENRIGATN